MSVFRFVRSAPVALLGLVCAVFPGVALAQQPASTATPSGPLTLEQVLELAAGRSESVAIARAGLQRAAGDELRAKSALLPQLSVSGGYDRALASEFSGVFDNLGDGGSAGGSDGTDFSNLPFGRANTWRASVAVSQNVYTGGRITQQRRLAALGQTGAEQQLTTARGQLLFDATQAYYDAALADRLIAIAQATVEQATATLQQVEAGYRAGTQPEFEVLRARVNRENQQPVLIRQRMNRDLAVLRLQQLLDLPANTDLRLADSLAAEQLDAPPVFATRIASVERELVAAGTSTQSSLGAGITPPDRTVVGQAETAVQQQETALRLAEAQKLPTVSLNSTYTRLGYPTNGVPLFDRTNWTAGVAVQVPLFTGGRQRGDEQVAQAELAQAKLRLQQTRELATLDTQSAWAELLAARAAWEATAGTVQQAQRAYEIADVRYRNGVSTQLELTDARLLLQQAEANRAVAARDLQVARARVALLPDLPLGATAAAAAAVRPTTPPVTPQAPSQQQPAAGIRTVSTTTPSQTGTQ